jgi:hypothetical protein
LARQAGPRGFSDDANAAGIAPPVIDQLRRHIATTIASRDGRDVTECAHAIPARLGERAD